MSKTIKPDNSMILPNVKYPETIAEAKGLYRKYGSSLVSKDYKYVINGLLRLDFPGEIPNYDYVHALFLADLMFQNTSKSLRMITGAYGKDFLADLESSFLGALERISRNRGFVHMIALGGDSRLALQPLQDKFRGTLRIFIANLKKNEELNHTIICDNRMLRVEEPHSEIVDNMSVEDIKASVFFNNPGKAKVASEAFDSMWRSLNRMKKQPAKHPQGR